MECGGAFGVWMLERERERERERGGRQVEREKEDDFFFLFQNDARKFVSDRTKSEVFFLACWESVKFCRTTWYS